ncbi:MAG: ABC transporter ATP-binding protein [Hyphomicrobiaceae bacterium]|nr:ABC transporter ATP-binding protein [Hyphomicrobiaceae bacterium]
MSDPLLTIRDLSIDIETPTVAAKVIDHANVQVHLGETVGIVGESGCGKTTLLKAILGILPKTAVCRSGEILFEGRSLLDLWGTEESRRIRSCDIGFIPQDPYLSLNPAFTVGRQLNESLLELTGQGAYAELLRMLRAVQLPDPEGVLERYPHQFSGGQRQRLLIAAALARRPKLLIADEPTTALDVTTQSEILEVMRELANETGVAMLFVSHDLGVIRSICDRVTVMYAGQSVETAPADALVNAPKHPYTRMLLNCHPGRSHGFKGIPGQVASPLDPPPGCRFSPRCPIAIAECSRRRPQPLHPSPSQEVSCPRYEIDLETAADA